MLKEKKYIISGVSLPKDILLKIDSDRGLVPRSRFLTKLIEIAYSTDRIKLQKQFFTRDKHVLSDESLAGPTSDY